MALIDLKTDLKSLKFGKDRPGGGSSNEPYIQTPIPDGDTSTLFSTGGPDSVLRGGLIAPIRAGQDVSRLTQLFFDLKSPKGVLFTSKTNLLSRMAVKTEAKNSSGDQSLSFKGPGAYLPNSTIAQAGVGFLGTHLNLFSSQAEDKYETVAKFNNSLSNNSVPITTTTTRFITEDNIEFGNNELLLGSESPTQIRTQSTSTTGGYSNKLLNIWYNKQIESSDSINIYSYRGGPGSNKGIGQTYIKFADQRTGKRNPYAVSDPGFFYGTNHRDKYSLSPESKDISTKLKGVTNSASQFLPSEENREEIAGFENPNRITGKYYVLDRSTTELNTNNPVTSINYDEVISLKGASNTYNNLIEPIEGRSTLDNEYTNKNFFNVYDPNITPGNTWPTNTPLQSANGSSTYTQKELIQTTPVSKNGTQQDFRKTLLDNTGATTSTIMSLYKSYNPGDNKTIEGRVNLGNPGTKKDVYRYSTSTEPLDKINALEIYSGNNVDRDEPINDLVKFRIAVIDNNSTTGNNFYLHFRAFINSFDDNYNAEWNPTKYVGRGENFYNYQGFTRQVNVSFDVVAQSKPELIPMYKKLNYLASTLTPDYSKSGFMRGNIAKLTMGGYLYEQPGIINSLSISIPEESTWEIAIDEEGKEDDSVKELPHMVKVTMAFTPIHTFLPQRVDSLNNTKQRYIALANGEGDENNNY